MSVSYFVRYDVAAPDLKGFLERYRKLHVPLVAKWPGLRRMVMHTPVDWRDPFDRLELDQKTALYDEIGSKGIVDDNPLEADRDRNLPSHR